jgi:hypothetical protein
VLSAESDIMVGSRGKEALGAPEDALGVAVGDSASGLMLGGEDMVERYDAGVRWLCGVKWCCGVSVRTNPVYACAIASARVFASCARALRISSRVAGERGELA